MPEICILVIIDYILCTFRRPPSTAAPSGAVVTSSFAAVMTLSRGAASAGRSSSAAMTPGTAGTGKRLRCRHDCNGASLFAVCMILRYGFCSQKEGVSALFAFFRAVDAAIRCRRIRSGSRWQKRQNSRKYGKRRAPGRASSAPYNVFMMIMSASVCAAKLVREGGDLCVGGFTQR